jgi:hypothetical protein
MYNIERILQKESTMNKNRLYSSCPMVHNCIRRTQEKYLVASPSDLESMSLDAYIFGYPLVLMDVTKSWMMANGSRINQFLHQRVFPDSQFTTIVRPNVDTLYSMAWLDLAPKPIILHVPNTHDKYYIMEFLDAWTNVFASVGARTTGTRETTFAIVGPQWHGILPQGVSMIHAPTNTVWIIGRTQTNGPKDYPIVHRIQDKYTLTSFNAWESAAISCSNIYPQNPMNHNQPSPADQVANMNAAAFFQTMMTAMYRNPPLLEDPVINIKLAALDLVPSENFNFYNLNPAAIQALEEGVTYGPKKIKAASIEKYKKNNRNGWNVILKNIGFYGFHYMQRAIIAMSGIGANLPQDAVYGSAFTGKSGKPLHGNYCYVIHFDKSQLPPVHAFWSITLYNTQGFLVRNAIHRYAVSPHLGKVKYNPNGSLDIFIQNRSPGKDKSSNWLPTPKGLFNLTLRMYWPKQPVLNGDWRPPWVNQIVCSYKNSVR